jgi:hypothetical protein
MKTMIRRLVAVASLALSSALFAGSIDFSTSSSTIDITVWGVDPFTPAPTDCQIELLNTDTNQVVADMVIYTGSASIYNGGNTYVSGVGLTMATAGASITGVASGNYRIITYVPMPWNWGSYSSGGGGWGGIVDYEYSNPYNEMQYGISNSGGWFY